MTSKRTPDQLRSFRWFGPDTMRGFAHRQRLQQTGLRRKDFMGKPVIGIINCWSDISTCHGHLRERAKQIKEGIIAAGGFPLEIPAMSLGEVMVKPTTMFYRNFLAMEVEELLRSHPLDGAVLVGGCDKTTPGLLMGAISMNLPALFVPAGATLSGHWRGTKIGTGTHTRKYWDQYRAGEISKEDWMELEASMVRSFGTCNTMGTASTMTMVAEALGMTLPGAACIPAADSAHPRMARDAGARAVDMVWEDLKPSNILTRSSFENAIATMFALGGSTNGLIHLTALAGRAGIKLSLDNFKDWAGKVPIIANLMPAGEHLMEDLFRAGGSGAIFCRIKEHLDLSCITVSGQSFGETIAQASVYDDDVVRPLDSPVSDQNAFAILHGNLAPDGAVIKPSAATPKLLKHTGKAVVFETHAIMSANIDNPDLDITEDSIIVLQNAGPVGGPGMPEWGALPIPKKLLKKGVTDMVRISDSRMSGTHFGTCVLHVTPESAIGGPLSLVRSGDIITLDVAAGSLHLHATDDELAQRRKEWKAPKSHHPRGYGVMYAEHITQATEGCDFDFLMGTEKVPEPEIY